jgi:hypothetical protein
MLRRIKANHDAERQPIFVFLFLLSSCVYLESLQGEFESCVMKL